MRDDRRTDRATKAEAPNDRPRGGDQRQDNEDRAMSRQENQSFHQA